MFITNHALAGATLGLLTRRPAVAFVTGMASHVAMDMVLHWGDERLDWTAGKLREFGVKYLLGGHCTGIEAVYRLRQQIGLTRQECVVSAVGSSFTLDRGIDPLLLSR